MSKHFQYASYVIRHKWFVMLACFRMGLYWRGIKHDLSKLLPSEWVPYTNYFYGRQFRDETGYYKPTDMVATAAMVPGVWMSMAGMEPPKLAAL